MVPLLQGYSLRYTLAFAGTPSPRACSKLSARFAGTECLICHSGGLYPAGGLSGLQKSKNKNQHSCCRNFEENT